MTVGLLSFARLAVAQGGLSFINPTLFANYDAPLINVMEHADRVWEFSKSGVQDYNPANFTTLDRNGMPTSMLSGVTDLKAQIVLWSTNPETDIWVFTWDGVGTLNIQSPQASNTTVITANRVEFTVTNLGTGYPPPLFNIILDIQSAPISNIKVFLKAHEAAMNAGAVTNPDFIDLYKQFYGIRFMNWQNTNGSLEGDWNLRTLPGSSGSMFRGDMYNGVPSLDTAHTNDFTCPTAYTGNPSSWSQAMSLLCGSFPAIIIHTIDSITTGTTTTVKTSTTHNMSSGQRYMFTFSNVLTNPTGDYGTNLTNKIFSITVIGSDTFTLDGVNSTGWTGTIPPTGMPALRIKAGNLPYKECYASFMGSFYNILFNGPGEDAAFEGAMKSANQFVYDSITDSLLSFTVSRNSATNRGLSMETMVRIANDCNIHPWFCIPILASDEYTTNFITYVRDHLNSNLIAHFEKGNENWDTGVAFPQSSYALKWANQLFGALGDQKGVAEYSGYASHHLHTIVTSIYAGQMNRVKRVVATWASQYNSTYMEWQLQALDTPAANLILGVTDALAYAPYIEPDRSIAPTAEMVYLYKTGDTATQDAQLQLLDQMFNASDFTGTGYISGSTLTMVTVTTGEIDVGACLNQFVSGVTPGTWVMEQLTGTPNGPGTYQINNSQTIGLPGSPVALQDGGVFTRKLMKNLMFSFFNAYCVANGLEHLCYEGGWGVYPQFDQVPTTYLGNTLTTDDVEALWFAYHSSSYWGATFLQLMHDFKSVGGAHWNQFQVTGIEWGFGEQFGELISGIYGDKSKPGYQALLTYNSGN